MVRGVNYFLRWPMRSAERVIKTVDKARAGKAKNMELSMLGILRKQSGKSIDGLYAMAADRLNYATRKGPEIWRDSLMEMGYTDISREKMKILRGAI